MKSRMKLGIVVTALLVSVCSVEARDRVVGLLTLPEVFGAGPCDAFTPGEVPLYPAADSAEPIGVIRVERYWSFPEAGGCEGLLVTVHMREGQRVRGLPTKEFTYEAPAAVVLEVREGWFKLRLDDGAAWVKASPRREYLPLEILLPDGLTYMTGAYEGPLFSSPGGDELGCDGLGRRLCARPGGRGCRKAAMGSRRGAEPLVLRIRGRAADRGRGLGSGPWTHRPTDSLVLCARLLTVVSSAASFITRSMAPEHG